MVELMKPLAKITKRVTTIKPVARVLAKVSKKSPELFAITGAGLIIWGFVEAIEGGTKLKVVMDETAGKVERIEAAHKEQLAKAQENDILPSMILEEQSRELRAARKEGTWKVVKLFWLPSGLLVIGLCLIGKGHLILKKRNVVLAGAAEGYKKILENYRKNVVDKEGEEADLKYLRGVVDDKEVETLVVDENGKTSKVKERVPVVREQKGNPWRFEFSDVYFDSYEDNTDRNLFFLKCEEDWWNHELNRHDEVSMYEILKHLGYRFEVLKASCKNMEEYRGRMTFLRNYGWRKGCGDGFIDFGLYRAINEPAIARKSDVCWIEFNCAGNLQNLSK